MTGNQAVTTAGARERRVAVTSANRGGGSRPGGPNRSGGQGGPGGNRPGGPGKR